MTGTTLKDRMSDLELITLDRETGQWVDTNGVPADPEVIRAWEHYHHTGDTSLLEETVLR